MIERREFLKRIDLLVYKPDILNTPGSFTRNRDASYEGGIAYELVF